MMDVKALDKQDRTGEKAGRMPEGETNAVRMARDLWAKSNAIARIMIEIRQARRGSEVGMWKTR